MGNGSKRTIELERLDYSLEDAIIDTNFDGHIDHTNFEFIELRLGNHCNVHVSRVGSHTPPTKSDGFSRRREYPT